MDWFGLIDTLCSVLMVCLTLLGLIQFRVHTERVSFRFGQG